MLLSRPRLFVVVTSLLLAELGTAWAAKRTGAASSSGSGTMARHRSKAGKTATVAAADRRGAASARARGLARRRTRERFPALTLINPHWRRNNRIRLRVYDRAGRFRPQVVSEARRFFRCHRTGKQHRIHPRLIRGLYDVARHFGQRPIVLHSSYRHRSVSWTPRSFHTKGMAADIRVQGVSSRRLRDYLLRRFPRAGVGYYTNVPFIHFDARGRSAFWIDFSKAGERPRYARNARRLLALERRGVPIRDVRRKQTAPRKGSTQHVAASAPTPRPRPLGPPPAKWARVVLLDRDR